MKPHKLFVDNIDGSQAGVYSVQTYVLDMETPYQKVEILDTPAFGRMLAIDGRPQVSERDEFVYHEMLVHPALLPVSNLESVMIIGGGPGGTLREVCRYKSVRRILMVDIDERLVSACRLHMPRFSAGAFEDPRLEIRFEDARSCLEQSQEQFDAIIVDLTGPVAQGASERLWTEEFFRLVQNHLKQKGIVATHSGPLSPPGIQWPASMMCSLQKMFPFVRILHAHIPCFGLSNPWSFMVASGHDWLHDVLEERVDEMIQHRLGELKAIDGKTYLHAFTLPKHLRVLLQDQGCALS